MINAQCIIKIPLKILLLTSDLVDFPYIVSLGRSESNGVRFDLFRSTIDIPGQVKLNNFVSRLSFS